MRLRIKESEDDFFDHSLNQISLFVKRNGCPPSAIEISRQQKDAMVNHVDALMFVRYSKIDDKGRWVTFDRNLITLFDIPIIVVD